MNKRSLAIVLLVSLPALVLAQRGGGGGGRDRGTGTQADYSNMGSTIKLTNKDVENISPLKLLIDKRKDLKLTDDQLAKLKDREDKMKESMKPSFGALDSLRRIATPAGRTADEGDKARMMDTRRQFTQVVAGIRTQYDIAFNDIVPLLDESQQKTANDLVQKQRAEADDMLHDKLGGGPGSNH
jgi:LTXXQ motif family protein